MLRQSYSPASLVKNKIYLQTNTARLLIVFLSGFNAHIESVCDGARNPRQYVYEGYMSVVKLGFVQVQIMANSFRTAMACYDVTDQSYKEIQHELKASLRTEAEYEG